jgi:membrane protease YdiL (CAAX protease family)
MTRNAPVSGIIECFVLFLVLFNPLLPVAGPLPAADPARFDSWSYHLAYWIQALPQIALLFLLRRRRAPASAPARPSGLPSLLGRSAALAAALCCLAAALVGLRALVIPLLGLGAAASGGGYVFSRPELLPLAVLTGLCTGYREELFFRASLIPEFESAGLAPAAAIALSSLFFASVHLSQGWFSALSALLLGIPLGWRFQKRRDPHEVSLGHAFYDIAVLCLSLAGRTRAA